MEKGNLGVWNTFLRLFRSYSQLDDLPIAVLYFELPNLQLIYANKAAESLTNINWPSLLRGNLMPEECLLKGRFFDLLIQPDSRGVSDATGLSVIAIDVTTKVKIRERLQSANRELDLFASTVAHEIKAPLRTITTAINFLVQKMRVGLDSESNFFMEQAADSSRRLFQLVDDLLEYSRAGDLAVCGEEIDSSLLFDRVLADMRTLIAESKARITRAQLPSIQMNKSQLHAVFQNLLENAIKFHREIAPEIEVSVSASDSHWIFKFRDNGIGIPFSDTEKVFMPFCRLNGADQVPGSGIGLATCRRIIERIGGKIWVESQLGNGSIFYFSVPKLPGAANPAQ